MKACGLITEYNPFHQGHLYHVKTSKQKTNADCMVAVMSGNFLQRGEPAITDKFNRTKTALQAGVDLVVELPFIFAVQNSDFFAKGAISTLAALGVPYVCFGSERGEINPFIDSCRIWKKEQHTFQGILHEQLDMGLSFPEASRKAYQTIGLTEKGIDLTKPNNILGFSYVKEIIEEGHLIEPTTIKRIENNYHDQKISGRISSATSIRKEILNSGTIAYKTKSTMPEHSVSSLQEYRGLSGTWHQWENYFPFLQYKVATLTPEELRTFHGMEEGLEFRLKKTARDAINFQDWMKKIKTKRYTWTRLQRLFVHLLVNSKKSDIIPHLPGGVSYVRVLGMSSVGRSYLNKVKKDLDVPLFSQLQQIEDPAAQLEERAAEAYYSPLSPAARKQLIQKEYMPPIMVD